jgi:hypothetical protein
VFAVLNAAVLPPGGRPADAVGRRPAGGTLVARHHMAGDAGAVTGPVTAGLLVDRASYAAAFGPAASAPGLAGVPDPRLGPAPA